MILVRAFSELTFLLEPHAALQTRHVCSKALQGHFKQMLVLVRFDKQILRRASYPFYDPAAGAFIWICTLVCCTSWLIGWLESRDLDKSSWFADEPHENMGNKRPNQSHADLETAMVCKLKSITFSSASRRHNEDDSSKVDFRSDFSCAIIA